MATKGKSDLVKIGEDAEFHPKTVSPEVVVPIVLIGSQIRK